MDLSQKTLLILLEDINSKSSSQSRYEIKVECFDHLTPIEMASLYINSALLTTIMDFLREQFWLKNKKDIEQGRNTSYEKFITALFYNELKPVLFLKDFLVKSGEQDNKKVSNFSQVIEQKVLSDISKRSNSDQKVFATQSLNEMTIHYLNEEKEQEGSAPELGHRGLRLYRTFDGLDNIFNFNYKLDLDMELDHDAKERLFQRAGVGVQSGYSTILLALNSIETRSGGKIIDLGSGYGRVGLVCSLMRPDINFIGYEYVPHRVEVSNAACTSLDLNDSLNSEVQDLSLESFKIPQADVYYLYDPFTKDTYSYVLKQIVEVSKTKKVTIVTKGNARTWLVDIADENLWPAPVFIDKGNLCVFRSS